MTNTVISHIVYSTEELTQLIGYVNQEGRRIVKTCVLRNGGGIKVEIELKG
ncbi:hypothetical protein [Alkalibacillus almallahensis]|uniref:hypothetical protein n=1 Tax=Alkalibacillus almallahensis TaxID=1379154 RepID=UPI00141FF868|nr:hypothetical protein [Alkalibacillus almallahensis]NIK11142.1 tmRNA-binding protein [Alkalibacillus almallahensis]